MAVRSAWRGRGLGSGVRASRLSGVYRATVAVALVLVASGTAMVSTGAAWASSKTHQHIRPRAVDYPVFRFDDYFGAVELIVPTPACAKSDPGCEWMLYVNEPGVKGAPLVAWRIGTSGILTVMYPPDFCGGIQADALIGPASWVRKASAIHHIYTCESSTTTTSTSSTSTTSTSTTTTSTTSTTSTTLPATTTTASTSSTVPPSTTSTTATPSSLPFTAGASGSTTTVAGGGGATSGASGAAGTTAPHAATGSSAQLPFTGFDPRPLIVLGSLLIVAGGLLLTTVEQRRRMLRRAGAIRVEHAKDGARKASNWFFGL